MKKTVLLVSILLLSNSGRGNPIPMPQAFISEFMFTTNNQWEMEVVFGLWGGTNTYLHNEFDSICVATSAGTARIKLDFIKDGTSLLVITPDSLTSLISVDRNGDSIKLYSFLAPYGFRLVDSVSFGKFPGANFDSIPKGCSICRFGSLLFALDNHPTIGSANDSSGACGTLRGFIYNGNGNKILSGNFLLDDPDDHPLVLNGDGTYTAMAFARKFVMGEIFDYYGEEGYQPIDTLRLDVLPDSVIQADIQFINVVGIKTEPVPSNPDLYIISYPNPFNPGTNFYVRIPDNLKSKSGHIDIYNSIGQEVFVLPLSNSSSYKWNGVDMSGRRVASGVYYYRLVFANAVYKTGSMILLK